MKTRSALFVPALALALFVAGAVVARALALPVPAAVAGVALAMLGLRVGVMFAATEAPAVAAPRLPVAPDADAREPMLRAANG